MSNIGLDRSNLGDLSGALGDHEAVADLSWMDIAPGEADNFPSESPREVIPQLEAQWTAEKEAGDSGLSLLPNRGAEVHMSAPKDKPVSDAEIQDVVRVAKRAMMSGFMGKDIVPELRARFASEVLDAAQDELKKVAAEEGLLGNVYLDLGAYRTTKEALTHLGHHKIRLASFAVGSPSQEPNFKDPSGNCRNLGKKVVDKVAYTGEVLSHYANHLHSIGALPKEASLETKEQLRQAFLTARMANKNEGAPEEKPVVPQVTDEQYSNISKEVLNKAATQQSRLAAEVRIAQARPILAKIQGLMLQGARGEDLKRGIRAACDSCTVDEFLPEISNLVGQQGVVGPVLLDVSMFDSVPDATTAINKAPIRPIFIVNSLPHMQGLADRISARTGIPQMRCASDMTQKHAAAVIDTLNKSSRLSDASAAELLEKAKVEKPLEVVKQAILKSDMELANRAPKMATSVPFGSVYTPGSMESSKPKADREKLREAATTALDKGISAEAVQRKMASYIPIGEAIGIMRESMAALDCISAEALDSCQSERYSIKKTASLVKAAKCNGCTFCIGASCSKQARSFKMANVRVASAHVPDVDPSVTLQMGSFNAVDFDLSGVVIPARTPVGMNVTLSGNGVNF